MARIKHLAARNFQSLVDINLELGSFNVIVGASSSGKSAIGRALRLLTSNKAGTDYITRGTTQCYVAAQTDAGSCTIGRGKSNSYDVSGQTYTKLGTGVPEVAQAVIGLAPGDQPNFASQFDPPYLLAESGTSGTATVFGKLTNVDILFAASREANRRRLAEQGQVRTYSKLISDTEQSLLELPDIEEMRTRAEEAGTALATAAELLTQHRLLDQGLRLLTTTAAAYQRLPQPRDLPDLSPLEDLISRRRALQEKLTQLDQINDLHRDLAAHAVTCSALVESASAAYRAILLEAGKCPTCGQIISEEHLHDNSPV